MADSSLRDRDQEYFERARAVSAEGKLDDAIELYLQGLSFLPDIVPVHQELRDVGLRRKAA